MNVFTSFTGDEGGRLVIELAPAENRQLSGQRIVDAWRDKVGDLPDVVDLDFRATLNQPGSTINIELASSSLDDLRVAANGLKEQLIMDKGCSMCGTRSRRANRNYIELKPVARNLGLSLDDVAMQVRQAYHGIDVQNLQRGEQDVKVVVRYTAEERSSLWYLENMSIRLRDGSNVPLLTVADIEYGEGASQIDRHNRRRIIRVSAKVDDNVTSPARVMEDLKTNFLDTLSDRYPGMTWSIAGAQKEKEEFKEYLVKAYIFALMAMYIMMAVLFRSYAQPLMVMSAVPFGLIGALSGHVLAGLDLTVWSLVGMIAVSGVVVNDNLVLVDFMNSNRDKGISLLESIRKAGVARFRPIMLTSLTTFGGLAPLMLEKSLQAQFLIPMAVSLAFGVMFATVISLVLVPALYHIVYDMENVFARVLGWYKPVQAPAQSVAAEVDRSFNEVAADDSDKLQWHIGLDEAYDMGYKEGLKGDVSRNAPFDLEVLVASWEAGWDDGHEEYLLKQGSGVGHTG
ncbi:MAG: efflux RND transporter permease subunit [Gammaproteobacteria bacterium]